MHAKPPKLIGTQAAVYGYMDNAVPDYMFLIKPYLQNVTPELYTSIEILCEKCIATTK